MSEQIELRNKMKKKRPKFLAQDYHKKAKLKKRWRKARGSDSKVRLKIKGYIKKVSIGYRSPKAARGLLKNGLKPIVVKTSKDLQNINEKHGIILSSKLGLRKKLSLLKEIKDKNLQLINVKDIDDFIKKSEEKIAAKKKAKEEKQKAAKEKQKEKEKKSKETELEKKVESEEDKKERERKEQDKLLKKLEN